MAARKVALHVVYGIPCVGKSTTAVQFACHHQLKAVIPTDYVREVQRSFVSPAQAPALAKVTHTAWELHGPPTRSNIEAGFLDHVAAVADGIRTVARKLVSDGLDAVIEGAHFHGGLIADLVARHPDADLRATLLIVSPAEELRRRVIAKESARAAGAARKRWQDHLTIMLALQDFLIADAHRHGIAVTTPDEWKRSWLAAPALCSTSTTS
jgi:2-phosphoglycerate kinase